MNSFTVYLVRHGSTMLNSFNRMQGWIDSDLSDEGIQQVDKPLKNYEVLLLTALFLQT